MCKNAHQESSQERLEGSQWSHLKPKLLKLLSPLWQNFPRHVQNHTVALLTPLFPTLYHKIIGSLPPFHVNSIVYVNSAVYVNNAIYVNSTVYVNSTLTWIVPDSKNTTNSSDTTVRKLMGEADTQLKWNWKKNKEQAQKKTPENYVVRLLAYVHGRRQKENILLVKRNYKYYGLLSHYPKSQYTQSLTH